MKLLIIIPLIFVTPLTVLGQDTKGKCTREDAIRAETEASSLKTWADVYGSYERFAQCDDAAIGEGYSSSVARLLSDDWSSVSQLNNLAVRDQAFKAFVLRHVDELMSPNQQEKIRENASAHCSSGTKPLCRSVLARIKATSPSTQSREK